MRGHPSARWVALAATGVLFFLTSAAQAQDEPVVIGRQEKLPTFGYTPPVGAFTLLGQYSRDESSGGVSGSQESTEIRFEERLELQTTAYVVHPNFLNIPFNGEFGLIQEDFESDDFDDRTNTTLYLWNIEAQFFREQPLNFTLYTDRSENIIDRAFAESFRNLYTTYGAVLTTREHKLPTTLRVYRQEQTQESLGGGSEDFSINDNVLEWHTEFIPSPNQTLTWDYRLNQTDQQSSSGVSDDYTGQAATLAHTVGFGPGNAYTLNSVGIYTNTTGNFATERFHVDELLRLRHSRTFETEYQYIFDQQDTLTLDHRQQRGTAKFRHRLYDSLRTNGLIGALQLDSDDSQTQDLFANLDFNYTKKVPYGELQSTMDLGYTMRESSTGTSPIAVVDQPFFFAGFEPIIIPGQTVDPTSLFITSPIGQIFVEGIDYTVTDRPDGVRVDRVIGGAIPADSTVLIDYIILPVPDTQIDTAAFGLSLRYDILQGPLNGFSPYVRFGLVEQDVSGGGGIIEPDSVRAYVFGADYRFWSLILTGEYEIYDSTLVPFDALRFIARLNHRISGDTSLTGFASYVQTDYSTLDQQTTTMNATASVTHLLTPNLLVSAGLSWVDLDDSLGGRTRGLQELLDIRWRNRQVEVFARLRNANRDSDDSETNFQFFELGLRREF